MVKVASVGFGYWGPNLVRNLNGLDRCELAACCDLSQERLDIVHRMYPNVKTTTSYQELLDDREIDAIVLATPARTHFQMASQALLPGKHVLVEKPLAMHAEDCQGLIDLAERQGRVLMVGHTFMYSPALLKVKALADPSFLGQAYYLYTQRVNLGQIQTDLNALWSIAPHDVSIALFLLGGFPERVSAQGFCYLSETNQDVVFLTLTFPGGVIAHIHVSWLDPSKVRKVTLVGSKRMIVYDDLADEGKVKVYDKGALKVNGTGSNPGEFHYRLHSGDIHAPTIPMTEPLANECAHFIECIEEHRKPVTDGANGLQVVRVLEAAQRSLESGGIPVNMATEVAVAR